VLLLGTIIGAWWASQPSTAIERSRQVKLGQTYAEVLAVMGPPNVTVSARPGPIPDYACFGDAGRAYKDGLLLRLRHATGINIPISNYTTWPVVIHFSSTDRVDRIKRGSEIIKAEPASQVK
jgi:hypothetical protein